MIGVQIAQHKIGVGNRGLGPALRIARRTGHGRRTVGSHLKRSHRRAASNAAPTRPDLDQIDDGNAHGNAAAALEAMHMRHFEVVGADCLAAFHQRQFGRRAAHIEGKHAIQMRQPGEVRST